MNATVTLPIGDLDKLRNDLKESQDKVKFFEKNEKVVKLQIREHSFGQELTHGTWQRNHYMPGYSKIVDKYIEKDPEYINFEDVKIELKREAENSVIKQIGGLNREIIDLKKKLEDKETQYLKNFNEFEKLNKEKIEKLEDKHFKNVERIQDEHEIQRTKLEKEICILKGEDTDTEQEKKIKELTTQISKLRGRSLLERLFNL